MSEKWGFPRPRALNRRPKRSTVRPELSAGDAASRVYTGNLGNSDAALGAVQSKRSFSAMFVGRCDTPTVSLDKSVRATLTPYPPYLSFNPRAISSRSCR